MKDIKQKIQDYCKNKVAINNREYIAKHLTDFALSLQTPTDADKNDLFPESKRLSDAEFKDLAYTSYKIAKDSGAYEVTDAKIYAEAKKRWSKNTPVCHCFEKGAKWLRSRIGNGWVSELQELKKCFIIARETEAIYSHNGRKYPTKEEHQAVIDILDSLLPNPPKTEK